MMGRTGTRPRRKSLAHTCAACGYGFTDADWRGYFCPVAGCGRLNARLYREEHINPGLAMFMTEAEIAAEFAAAGMPMAPIHLSRGELNGFRDVPRKAG